MKDVACKAENEAKSNHLSEVIPADLTASWKEKEQNKRHKIERWQTTH